MKCKTWATPLYILPKAFLVLLLTFVVSAACYSEDTAPAKMTVADAVMRALDINTNIKQAEASQLSSLSSLRVAKLSTSYGLGSLTNLNHSPDDAGLSSRTYGNIAYESLLGTQAEIDLSPLAWGSERGSVSLSYRRPLWAGSGLFSKRANALAGANSDATIQEKQLYLTRQATVLNVIQGYYQAILAREQVKVQEHAVAIADEAATGARKRADAGLVSGIDVSRAEIRVAQTADQLNIQKQTARAAMDRLMTAIGAGVGEEPELVDNVPEPPTDLPDLAEAVKIALANRAEFSIFDERLADQNRKVALAEDDMRPKLDLVASFNSANSDAGIVSRSTIDSGAFEAGFEYRVPLDKRITKENKATVSRDLDVLKRLKVFQMEDVTEQVRSAYRNVDSSRTTLKILGENVKVAEDNLSLAQRMVDEGIDDNRIVLDAQDSLTQVENGLLSAKVDLYLAAINLKYAMGQDLTDVVIK